MNIFVIFGIIVIGLLFVAFILSTVLKKTKQKLEESKKAIIAQQKNITELVVNAEEINKNKVDKAKTEKEVKEAKSDEEVKAVVDSIVTDNNKRVQKSTTNKASTSTKARKAGTKKA